MKTYGGVLVQTHVFLISVLFLDEWSALRSGLFTPGTHWIGFWVDPRAGLDGMETWELLPSLGVELRTLGSPARSQSLYRLRYLGLDVRRAVPRFQNDSKIHKLLHSL
jgi:hypothetical protein